MSRPVSPSRLVGLVGTHPDLLSLLKLILEDRGYATQTYVADDPRLVDHLVQDRPNAIVVEVSPGPRTLTLLDDLRVTPATSAIPVIALGTLAPVQEQAQASGNVYAVLPMPFTLDELEEAVAGALAGTPFEARIQAEPSETDPAFGQAADILLRAERDFMLGWVQSIRAVEPFAGRPDIPTSGFLDTVPRILNALILVLRHQQPPDVLTRDPEMQERIREHACTRQQQGIPAEGVMREYQILRDVILHRLQRDMAAEDLQGVSDDLNRLMDEAMRSTVNEYIRLTRPEQTPP